MKKNWPPEEGRVSDSYASPSSSAAHVLLLLGGTKSVFINVIFEKAALYKTTSEQCGHIFFFLKPLEWENFLQEPQANLWLFVPAGREGSLIGWLAGQRAYG